MCCVGWLCYFFLKKKKENRELTRLHCLLGQSMSFVTVFLCVFLLILWQPTRPVWCGGPKNSRLKLHAKMENTQASRLRIVENDPWLEPVEQAVNERYWRYRNRLTQIESQYGSLANFATAHLYLGFTYDKKKAGWYYREWAPAAHRRSLGRVEATTSPARRHPAAHPAPARSTPPHTSLCPPASRSACTLLP